MSNEPCPSSATVKSAEGRLHGQDHGHLSLNNNGHVQEHGQLWNLRGHLHSQDHGHLSLHITAKSTTLSKICTRWISTGFRTDCPVGTLPQSANHALHTRAGWTYPTTTRRASTTGAATNVGDADLREEALQLCLCANEVVDDLVDARQLCNFQGPPAPSRPSAPVVAQQAGLCSTSGASPGPPACSCALSAVAPASSRGLTASTITGWAIRGRPVGHPYTTCKAIHRQPEGGGPHCHYDVPWYIAASLTSGHP